jgi:hypothetical protein
MLKYMLNRFFLTLSLICLVINGYSQTRSLGFYLEAGLKNSPLLNEYRNKTSSAGKDSLLIKAARKPFVEMRSQLLYSPFYTNFGYDEVITDGGNYTAVVGVSQGIFNRNAINNRLEAVEIQKKSLGYSSIVSIAELSKIITDQYLTTYLGYTDYLFNKSFLELIGNEDKIVKQFVISGVCRQIDYLSLVVENQTQEIIVNQSHNQYRKDLSLLNRLCGINDTILYGLTEPQLTVAGTPNISNSPSFLQYKIDSLRISNEKSAIDIRYKAKVNWFADAGFLTSNPWNFYKHFGYSAGLGMTIPVYDGKQRSIEKQKLEFDENTRKGYETRYRQEYFQQISQLHTDLKAFDDISVMMEKQLKYSAQLLTTLREQLEAGNIQMTEYINAVKNYRTLNRNISIVQIQKFRAINELNFILKQ